MNSVAKGFLMTSVVFGILGMLLGLQMAISEDHSQRPAHAHMLVIGWLSFSVFGLFYHVFDGRISGRLPQIHYWLATISLAGLIVGLWFLYSGNADAEPIAAISSIAYAISFLLFAAVVFRVTRQN